MSSDEQIVTLLSSDNIQIRTGELARPICHALDFSLIHTAERKVAERSMFVKNMIQDLGALEEPIPIMNVSEAVLRKILEWCSHHKNDLALEDIDADSLKKIPYIDDWDQKFMQVDQEMLFEIILGADYMDISVILDIGCKTVENMTKGKTPEEILEWLEFLCVRIGCQV